jgi:NAD(P)-dependent dehydrogenase (short-subunit alcohol dehydrogenase family)
MPIPLQEKVIVIVGGTGGIGLSAAKAFISSGAKVVAVGHDAERASAAEKALGANALVMTADAADPKAAPAAIQVALGNFKRFDGLYHVAGGSGRKRGDGPLHEISDAGWDYTLQLNLASVFYSNRAAAQQFLKQQTGGVVLNLSSVLGFSPSAQFFATHAYAAAKAGIIGLTKSSAAYYAGANIRFNVLAPGLVATRMSERAQDDSEVMQFIASKQPLDGGRIGRGTDLDAAAAYFLSDESRFVTGQVLAVDGGWSLSDGQVPVERPAQAQPQPKNLIRTLAGIWARLTKD